MSNLVRFDRSRQRRNDQFWNPTTAYGSSRDHGRQFEWAVSGKRLSKQQLDNLYATHEIAHKLVDLLPDDGTRKWVSFPKLDDEAQKQQIVDLLKETKFQKALNEGLRMARLHGGAALYLPIDDGQEDNQPVNLNRVRSIGEVQVIEKAYISPKCALRSLRHELYQVQIVDEDGNYDYLEVHCSRLIILQGARATRDWLIGNQGWGQSIIERCLDPLIGYSAAHGLVPNILKDIIRDVIKLQGLNELNLVDNADDTKAFDARFDAMFQAESLLNKTVLDTEDEYQRQTTSTAGVPEMIRTAENRLTAASGMPHTKLLGESPGASLSQSGSSQARDWAEAVSGYQEDCIRPAIEKYLEIICEANGLECPEFVFNPLDVPTTDQQADTLDKIANALQKLVDAQIISAAEAATCLSGSELSALPRLDLEARAGLESLHGPVLEDMLTVSAPAPMPQPNQTGVPNNGPQSESQTPDN